MTKTEYVRAKTSVWWDIENCEAPKGCNSHAIAQNVSSALLKMNYCGPLSISAYGDTNLIPAFVQQALSSTGVGLNHVPAGVKDASDKKILVDMLLWAVDNPAPANLMLISGDRDQTSEARDTKNHIIRISQAEVVASRNAQTSVSAKPVQVGELVECSVCLMIFTNKETYANHTYGKRDRNNLELQVSGKSDNMSLRSVDLEKQKKKGQRHAAMLSDQSKALVESKKLNDKIVQEKDQPRETIAEPKLNANHVCRLSNVVSQSQIDFDSHLKGKKHNSKLASIRGTH